MDIGKASKTINNKMQLRNHIAYKFLMDKDYQVMLLKKFKPYEVEKLFDKGMAELTNDEILEIGQLETIYPQTPKCYYITKTIIEKIDLLKIKNYNWNVFSEINLGKYVFIFDNNSLLSFSVRDVSIDFFYLSALSSNDFYKPKYLRFFLDKSTFEMSNEFDDKDMSEAAKHIYKLFCFFFLSENTEIIINAGRSHGTRKQINNLSNDLNLPVTIVNSNWNITSIRTDGFNVSGHFRLQPCGLQFSETKMIFIEPFKKHGYIRKAIKDDHV